MTNAKTEILIEVSKDLEDLIPEYIEEMNTSIGYLATLLESKNFEEIISEAHKMKGHGGAYGFRYISDIGSLIEGFAKDQKSEFIAKCLHELKVYLGRIRIEFRKDE